MSFPLYLTVWIVVAFLCGSVPFGWIFARAKGVDLRAIGSGNIGGTNVWRALGWQYGVVVLFLDALKGFAPVFLLQYCVASMPAGFVPPHARPWLFMLTALAAVLGHTFTPWLGFRGGKGVATGGGVVIALFQLWVLPVLVLFGLVLLSTRYVSLSSIMSAMLLAALSLSIPSIRPYWPFAVAALLLVLWTHRANIDRLMAGNESRVGAKKEEAKEPAESEGAETAGE